MNDGERVWKRLYRTLNQGVEGSNPSWPAICNSNKARFGGLFVSVKKENQVVYWVKLGKSSFFVLYFSSLWPSHKRSASGALTVTKSYVRVSDKKY